MTLQDASDAWNQLWPHHYGSCHWLTPYLLPQITFDPIAQLLWPSEKIYTNRIDNDALLKLSREILTSEVIYTYQLCMQIFREKIDEWMRLTTKQWSFHWTFQFSKTMNINNFANWDSRLDRFKELIIHCIVKRLSVSKIFYTLINLFWMNEVLNWGC